MKMKGSTGMSSLTLAMPPITTMIPTSTELSAQCGKDSDIWLLIWI